MASFFEIMSAVMEQFQEWKLLGADALSEEQAAIMKAVREAVSDLTEETVMKRLSPWKTLENI